MIRHEESQVTEGLKQSHVTRNKHLYCTHRLISDQENSFFLMKQYGEEGRAEHKLQHDSYLNHFGARPSLCKLGCQ